jgi:hypothetical protein
MSGREWVGRTVESKTVKIQIPRIRFLYIPIPNRILLLTRRGKKVQMKIDTEIKLRDRERHIMTNVTKKWQRETEFWNLSFFCLSLSFFCHVCHSVSLSVSQFYFCLNFHLYFLALSLTSRGLQPVKFYIFLQFFIIFYNFYNPFYIKFYTFLRFFIKFYNFYNFFYKILQFFTIL